MRMWNGQGHCFGGGNGFSHMGGGWMMWLLWGAVIALIVYAVSKRTSVNKIAAEPADAIHILKKRYSMGEMSTEEYKERLEELEK